ncbi:hypothetical protein HQ32_04930 [Prauserella sp. Am3]|nr:hypothetical protein HQ32_04930 [Prauserella sp. Am3]
MSRNFGRGQVEFRLGSDDISTIRFGISPGFELVGAVRVTQLPHTAPLHWGWLKTLDNGAPSSALMRPGFDAGVVPCHRARAGSMV